LKVQDEKVVYSYSLDEGNTFATISEPYASHFSWWKGARPALFSYTTDKTSTAGYADFDWIHVEQFEPARD